MRFLAFVISLCYQWLHQIAVALPPPPDTGARFSGQYLVVSLCGIGLCVIDLLLRGSAPDTGEFLCGIELSHQQLMWINISIRYWILSLPSNFSTVISCGSNLSVLSKMRNKAHEKWSLS